MAESDEPKSPRVSAELAALVNRILLGRNEPPQQGPGPAPSWWPVAQRLRHGGFKPRPGRIR
jgi:hypothetical protein